MRDFIVKKVFNNNVILAEDVKSGQEAVLVGRGLGYNARAGERVPGLAP